MSVCVCLGLDCGLWVWFVKCLWGYLCARVCIWIINLNTECNPNLSSIPNYYSVPAAIQIGTSSLSSERNTPPSSNRRNEEYPPWGLYRDFVGPCLIFSIPYIMYHIYCTLIYINHIEVNPVHEHNRRCCVPSWWVQKHKMFRPPSVRPTDLVFN